MRQQAIWKTILAFALGVSALVPSAGASAEQEEIAAEQTDAPNESPGQSPEQPPEAAATAAAGTHEVHVALFLRTNAYNAFTGAATLDAEGGLAVRRGETVWLRTEGGGKLRFAIDGYRVVVAETGDAAAAEALMLEARRASQPVSVFERTAGGKPLYSVEAGPYHTRDAAETARKALAAAPGVSARIGGAAMTLRGPLYARAGQYASEAEALAAAAPLWNAGVFAAAAVAAVDGVGVRYELWIGGAADSAALEKAISAAGAAVPGLSAAPVPEGTQYAVLRTDRAGDGALTQGVRLAAIGGGVKLSAAPLAPGAPIRVAERSGRSYRGAIDLFEHNGALAVVNRVDLEDYVASVVGSELDAAWPAEALKAQAVAARTYVLKQGWKYGVAHVSDTTSDQAYRGVEREFPAVIEAARATAGERLLLADGTLLDALYHSNAGGVTADPVEVWGREVPGMGSTESPDDAAERGKLPWYRVVLADGRFGYVRSDLVELTGEVNKAGFPLAAVAGDDVNIRPAPYVNNDTNAAFAQLARGTTVTIIDREMESTAYNWIRGPFTSQQVRLQMNASGVSGAAAAASGGARSIEVTSRGEASGRVTGIAVDGKELALERPDQYRTLFGLPSALFDVEQTARVDVLGAGGEKFAMKDSSSMTVVGAGGSSAQLATGAYLITNGDGTARVATAEPGFRFIGRGFGHGLGMSQWGAYGLAELGYDYRKILLYYYQDARVVKE